MLGHYFNLTFMNCPNKIGYGCFKTSCVRAKSCQEKKADANYEVKVIIQKTYTVNADSEQEAIDIVVGRGGPHSGPLPNKTEFVRTNVIKIK